MKTPPPPPADQISKDDLRSATRAALVRCIVEEVFGAPFSRTSVDYATGRVWTFDKVQSAIDAWKDKRP